MKHSKQNKQIMLGAKAAVSNKVVREGSPGKAAFVPTPGGSRGRARAFCLEGQPCRGPVAGYRCVERAAGVPAWLA